MTDEERSHLTTIRDALSLQLINLDAMLETDARYKAQVTDYREFVERRDGHSRRVPEDPWAGVKFGRGSKPIEVQSGVWRLAPAKRVFEEDGA